MGKKEVKTNAVRILERNKIEYELINYECDEFIDGMHTIEKTGAPAEQTYKTLVMQGKSKIRRDDPRQGSYHHYRLCPWRLQSTRYEKSVSNRHRRICRTIR